jgi:hypothetical protein
VLAGLGIFLVFVFFTPSNFVSIHPGESGVLWLRFGGGTVTVTAPTGWGEPIGDAGERPFYPYSEGLRFKFP